MGQGDGDRHKAGEYNRQMRRNRDFKNGGQAVDFDPSGAVTAGGIFDGLSFDQSALDAYRGAKAKQYLDDFMARVNAVEDNGFRPRPAHRNDPDVQAYRMYGTLPTPPTALAQGGRMAGLQFGSDGKLYGVIDEGDRSYTNPYNNAQETTRAYSRIEMSGWQLDTSTLPAGTPGKFYSARVQEDPDGNLIEISDPAQGNVVGWARQMIQRQMDPDSKLGGGRSRTASPGADSRVSNTLLGGPAGDPRKVTKRE